MVDFNSQEWFTIFESIAEAYNSRADQNFVALRYSEWVTAPIPVPTGLDIYNLRCKPEVLRYKRK